ncbi:hypothetical protein ACIA03_09905 [Nocardioides sp. NPDC051685]|uniref:hypothetical protein n=1 Tax=Nocardioides sp. NPDC051685 TaxID=3364334 RepID=UPI00379BE08F
MTTGVDLLQQVRGVQADSWSSLLGPGVSESVESVVRPAVVATLLTERDASDVDLLRAVTAYETASRAEAGDGCGDVLLACCWMLFCDGHLDDVPLIWQAKKANFDAYCYIDGVFLMPHGLDASLALATQTGHGDLLAYLQQAGLGDSADEIEAWRTSTFFAACPAPTSPIDDLAAWLRG